MKKLGLIVALLAGIAVAYCAATGAHKRLFHRWLEVRINLEAQKSFGGSVRFADFRIDRSLHLTFEGVLIEWQASAQPVVLRISGIESECTAVDLILNKPCAFRFQGARFQNSPYPGIRGLVHVKRGENWRLGVESTVELMSLAELEWVDQEHMRGTTGDLTGVVALAMGAHQKPELDCVLQVEEPGGLVQTRLFQLLVPYLPTAEQIRELSTRSELVAYRRAQVSVHLPRADQLKMSVHGEIPEYNLIINLNVVVNIDDERGVEQLLRVTRFLRQG